MGVVALTAITLGLLRSELGEVFALITGGLIGCGLAPWLALRGMKRVEAVLAPKSSAPAHRLSHSRTPFKISRVAQTFLLIFWAWFAVAVFVGVIGVTLARLLRQGVTG